VARFEEWGLLGFGPGSGLFGLMLVIVVRSSGFGHCLLLWNQSLIFSDR